MCPVQDANASVGKPWLGDHTLTLAHQGKPVSTSHSLETQLRPVLARTALAHSPDSKAFPGSGPCTYDELGEVVIDFHNVLGHVLHDFQHLTLHVACVILLL